jgi:putative sigma-54 modulation protein
MNLNINGHHLEVTPAIRNYVVEKLDRVKRHFDHVIDVVKLVQKAEVTLHAKGKDIHAEAHDEDMYAAIDALADKLDRQVLRHKDKITNHSHTPPKHMVIESE